MQTGLKGCSSAESNIIIDMEKRLCLFWPASVDNLGSFVVVGDGDGADLGAVPKGLGLAFVVDGVG